MLVCFNCFVYSGLFRELIPMLRRFVNDGLISLIVDFILISLVFAIKTTYFIENNKEKINNIHLGFSSPSSSNIIN